MTPSDVDELLEWLRAEELRCRMTAKKYGDHPDANPYLADANRFARWIAAVEELQKHNQRLLEWARIVAFTDNDEETGSIKYEAVPVVPEADDGN